MWIFMGACVYRSAFVCVIKEAEQRRHERRIIVDVGFHSGVKGNNLLD